MNEVAVLQEAGCSPDTIEHCIAVSKKAVEIAGRIGIPVDRELVRVGGLLHDIGRSKTQGVGHALAGVDILRGLGYSERLLRIVERHIGAGITTAEAERLSLPVKDYIPETVEEKIVSYADNLTYGIREMSFSETLDRFIAILGPDHEGVELFRRQHEEMQRVMK